MAGKEQNEEHSTTHNNYCKLQKRRDELGRLSEYTTKLAPESFANFAFMSLQERSARNNPA